MNQYLRDKTDEYDVEKINQSKTRHTELDTKQHEDRLRHLEVLKYNTGGFFLSLFFLIERNDEK